MRKLLLTYAATTLLAFSVFADDLGLNFVVHGTVYHEQFGAYPRQESYRFIARSQGCKWSISAVEEPKKLIDEVLAVGNDQGVFITLDLTTSFQEAHDSGKTRAVNNAQAIAMTNLVPSCTLAAYLGPIWLTYLSGCYLKNADPAKMPATVSLNVAGGSSLPLFDLYPQKSFWQVDEITGLPKEFFSMDEDGFQKGLVNNQLINLGRYSAPFDKGFTNITFHVVNYEKFSGCSLPQKTILEVFWIEKNNLERVHRFTIEAERFEQSPTSPLPEPTTKGIAAVADARLATQNGPIILQYLGTNRFLKTEELTNLAGFKEAVRLSLNRKPFQIISDLNTGARWVILAFLIISTVFLFFLLRNMHRKQ